MDDGEPAAEATFGKRTHPLLTLALGLALCGSMALLVTVLANGCSSGRRDIEAYIASVRGGMAVTPTAAGSEASALTALLRGTDSVSIGNFQEQRGTACFWVTLRGNTSKRDVRFLLDTDAHRVVALSALRECDCPIDADLPCRLVAREDHTFLLAGKESRAVAHLARPTNRRREHDALSASHAFALGDLPRLRGLRRN